MILALVQRTASNWLTIHHRDEKQSRRLGCTLSVFNMADGICRIILFERCESFEISAIQSIPACSQIATMFSKWFAALLSHCFKAPSVLQHT